MIHLFLWQRITQLSLNSHVIDVKGKILSTRSSCIDSSINSKIQNEQGDKRLSKTSQDFFYFTHGKKPVFKGKSPHIQTT